MSPCNINLTFEEVNSYIKNQEATLFIDVESFLCSNFCSKSNKLVQSIQQDTDTQLTSSNNVAFIGHDADKEVQTVGFKGVFVLNYKLQIYSFTNR